MMTQRETRAILKAIVKGHIRVVNGKTVYVHEYDNHNPIGRPAELHERTVVGRHRSGAHYLRATDAEDGAQIQAAADRLGIKTEKRRAGANHLGRVGAYDHHFVESPEHALAIHNELKKHAPEVEGESHPPLTVTRADGKKVNVSVPANTKRESLGDGRKRLNAGKASRDAENATKDAEGNGPKGHAKAAEAHNKAAQQWHDLGEETIAKRHLDIAASHAEATAAPTKKQAPVAGGDPNYLLKQDWYNKDGKKSGGKSAEQLRKEDQGQKAHGNASAGGNPPSKKPTPQELSNIAHEASRKTGTGERTHGDAAAAHYEASEAHFGAAAGAGEPPTQSPKVATGGEDESPKAKSDKAWEATTHAANKVKGEEGYAEGHGRAAGLHEAAADIHALAHDAGKGRDHYYEASRHYAHAESHAARTNTPEAHAEYTSKVAGKLGFHADSQTLGDNYESHGRHAEKHLLAIEAHGRARSAHQKAAEASFYDNKQSYDDHMKKADFHHAEVQRHNDEMGKGHKEIETRRESAFTASKTANQENTPEAHAAAAEAHRHAAKINYDEESRGEHEQKAKEHEREAEKAKPAEAPQHSPAIAKGIKQGDFRHILDSGTARKAADWEETKQASKPVKGNEDEVAALRLLHEKHGAHPVRTPGRDVIDHPGRDAEGKPPMEFIAKAPDGSHHYVNTEGYGYPRYTRHIPDDVAQKAGITQPKAADEPTTVRPADEPEGHALPPKPTAPPPVAGPRPTEAQNLGNEAGQTHQSAMHMRDAARGAAHEPKAIRAMNSSNDAHLKTVQAKDAAGHGRARAAHIAAMHAHEEAAGHAYTPSLRNGHQSIADAHSKHADAHAKLADSMKPKEEFVPPMYQNPHTKEADNLVAQGMTGKVASDASHRAIRATGDAVTSGKKEDHDDARAFHRLAATEHREHAKRQAPDSKEAAHMEKVAQAHDKAADWHNERGNTLAKPSDFATPESTDAFYQKRDGDAHSQARKDTEAIAAGTHKLEDGKVVPKGDEPAKKVEIAPMLKADHPARKASAAAAKGENIPHSYLQGGVKQKTTTTKATRDALLTSQIAEHSGTAEHHEMASNAHWVAAGAHEHAKGTKKGGFYYSSHSAAQGHHSDAAIYHSQKAQELRDSQDASPEQMAEYRANHPLMGGRKKTPAEIDAMLAKAKEKGKETAKREAAEDRRPGKAEGASQAPASPIKGSANHLTAAEAEANNAGGGTLAYDRKWDKDKGSPSTGKAMDASSRLMQQDGTAEAHAEAAKHHRSAASEYRLGQHDKSIGERKARLRAAYHDAMAEHHENHSGKS